MNMNSLRQKKLRILIISHMFPSETLKRHGIFMFREAKHLARFGIECDFLVSRPWAPWPLYYLPRWKSYSPSNALACPEDLQAREVRYLRPPGMWFRRFEGLSMAVVLRAAARNWHKQNPFDVVLGVPMIPDAEAAVTISKDLSLPLATLAIGSDVMVYPKQMPTLNARLKRILQHVDLPVGVSESICDKLAETGRCKRQPLCVYLGRDTEKFSPAKDKSKIRQSLGWAKDDVVAVYVGAVVETKGINELVLAVEKLFKKYRNFKLVCVGSGAAMEKLVRLRTEIDRDDAIETPGQVSPEQVPVFLQGSDFMVFPSHSEGMPQAVLEAMNCQLPVVATSVGGIPEAVIDGEMGILVEAKNVSQLRNALERMINDKEFRLSAGRKALTYAHSVFDSERNAEKFAKALRSLV
jgi:teichuronic acid biosynthesis glycosyltransferase TuaC